MASIGEETITITLGGCRNLRSTRGEVFTIFGQVSLGKTVLGESSRQEYKSATSGGKEEEGKKGKGGKGGESGGGVTSGGSNGGTGGEEESEGTSLGQSLNLEVKHTIKVQDPQSLDELVRNPLLVSVYEVLPKDKRAKEEKTQMLGISHLDLLPLIQGQYHIEQTLYLQPLNATSPVTENLPEVDVVVNIGRGVVPLPDDISNSNIMSLRVKGVYSLPEGWSPSPSVSFTIATPKPHAGDDNALVPLSLANGEIKSAGEVDLAQSMRLWKWAELSSATAGLSSLTDHVIESNAIEDESGQISSYDDIDFRRLAESRRPRIVWNSELRTYFTPTLNTAFLRQLSRSPTWPIELVRISSSSSGRGKSKEEETTVSHHGVAYLDLSSLLYPGVTRVFGAYYVESLNEIELGERTNEVHTKNIMESLYKSGAFGSGKKYTAKRPSTSMRASVVSINSAAETLTSESKVDGHVYKDARTYMLLELELSNPLVPKRPASVIAEKITEYITPHPALPRKVSGVEKAIKDFHTSTTDVAGLLLADYRGLFGQILEEKGELPNSGGEGFEERKCQLLYSLNTSGHYHAYKEHMKRSVVQIVREKFLNEANTEDEAEMQSFLSRLYTFLVDEMHNALGRVFSLEDSAPVAPTIVDCDMLRQYAAEAESMLDLEMAEYYHKELLSREEHIALHWYDYGVFFLLKGDLDNSRQCLKRAVALDQQFVPALLLYGMCSSLDECFPEADEVMELATTIDSSNLVAWTIRGLCYELSNNTSYRDMCFQEARKLVSSDADKTYITPLPKPQAQVSKELEEPPPVGPLTSHSISQADVDQAGANATGETTEPNDQPVTSNGGGGGGGGGIEPNEGEPENTPTGPPPTQLIKDEVTKSTQEIGQTVTRKRHISPFVQTAAYLLDVHAAKYAEMCLAHENVLQSQISNNKVLSSTDEGGTPTSPYSTGSVGYHTAVARLHLLRKEYKEAEETLSWAIKEDILNANLLALLGDCNYYLEDVAKAKDCYEKVVEYVTPPVNIIAVLLRLADLYIQCYEPEKAKQTYLRACRRASSSVTWKGVGISCYMLREYSEAEDALSEANMLNNLDPVVWAYLALVCYNTGRKQEANQAVNFAIKTGLKDPSLKQQLQVITQS